MHFALVLLLALLGSHAVAVAGEERPTVIYVLTAVQISPA